MFTPYYWACRYFIKFGDVEKAIEYGKLAIENAAKYYRGYWPRGDIYYSKRLKVILDYIKLNDIREGREFKRKYKSIVKRRFKI